jgi:hypothetical protein
MCPAGRAHFAWGGHFVTCVPFGRIARLVGVGDYAGLEFN